MVSDQLIWLVYSRKGRVLIRIIICTLYWKVILSMWYWQSHFPRSLHNLFVVLMSSAHVIITPDLLHPPDMILLRGITNTGSTYPEETWKNKACYFFGVTVSYWLTDREQSNNDGHKVFVNPPQPQTLISIISVSKIWIWTVQTTNSNLILIPNYSWKMSRNQKLISPIETLKYQGEMAVVQVYLHKCINIFLSSSGSVSGSANS